VLYLAITLKLTTLGCILMAKTDTFFLRTSFNTSGTDYVSDNIDISAYTDPARGRVLVVDKAFISFSTDAGGPILGPDIDAAVAWTAELKVGFMFEVHTEKLSLQRIQELLVSLTAN
jgi:hypothetical protein